MMEVVTAVQKAGHRMMEVENLAGAVVAGAVVAVANVVEKKFDDSAQELRRLHLPRRTCTRRTHRVKSRHSNLSVMLWGKTAY